MECTEEEYIEIRDRPSDTHEFKIRVKEHIIEMNKMREDAIRKLRESLY